MKLEELTRKVRILEIRSRRLESRINSLVKGEERQTDQHSEELEPILSEICRALKLQPGQLKSISRRRDVVDARHIYYRRAREMTSLPYYAIANYIGKNHATAIYGERQAYDVKEIDEKYRMIYDSRRSKND